MSEAGNIEQLEVEDVAPPNQPFADKVWRTLGAIDVTDLISEKTVKVKARDGRAAYQFKLNYISWVSAWQHLIECFPESWFEFAEPMYFNDGTGEQWVTVHVVEGEKELVRKWWLPYMDQTNRAVSNPSATQINTTRMRVLTKCIAMCGLGIEVYGGEDIQETTQDEKPVTNTPEGSVLPPEQLFEGKGHIDMINDCLPVDAIQTDSAGRIRDFDRERVDLQVLIEVLNSFDGKQELKLWVFENIHKLQNRFLRNYEKKMRDET